jgi:proline dehydrogenase
MSLSRRALLALSTNAGLRDYATRASSFRRSVARFMPGERLEDALQAAREHQARGITAILTHLGENLNDREQAEAVAMHYRDALNRIADSGLDAHISVKPTQLGLDLDFELCFRHLQDLAAHAARRRGFVWLDMESSRYVDSTLDLFRRVCEQSAGVGVALQAYLYRTAHDVERLLPIAPAIRLVKGAYLEPANVAFPKKADVDENYSRLAFRLLSADRGPIVHVATHDRRLIARIRTRIRDAGIARSKYEFAMLYGIQRRLQYQLAAEGERVRVLISYGDNWFPWYMRRLAERPANIWFVMKNLW